MKRGLLTVETIFLMIFITMLLVTIFSVVQFVRYQREPLSDNGSLEFAYQHLFLRLQQDALFSNSVKSQQGKLTLLGPNDREVTYVIASNTLSRLDKKGYQHVLIRNIASGGWYIEPSPRRMFSLWLIPQQKMGIPFFTSFALRGVIP